MMHFLRNLKVIFVCSMIASCLYGAQERPKSTPLIDAIERQDNIESIKDLIKRGANVNEQDKDGFTPLISATFRSKRRIVNSNLIALLLEAGADPNIAEEDGGTPLYFAINDKVYPERYETIKLLLKAGANSSLRESSSDLTPLGAAVMYEEQNTEIILLLLKANFLYGVHSDPRLEKPYWSSYKDYLDKYLTNPFDQVVHYISIPPTITTGYSARLKKTIGNIPLNQQDELGATLLMYAAAAGNLSAVEYLLKTGADPFIKTYNGRTARSMVRHILTYPNLTSDQKKRYEKILELLNKPIYETYRTIRLLEKPVESLPSLPKDVIRYIYPFVQASYLPPKTSPTTPPSIPAYGTPGGPGFVPVAAAARAAAERKNSFASVLLFISLATMYGSLFYDYFKEPEKALTKDELTAQLITALTSKNFEHAYRLAKKNPEALREISADPVAKHDLVKFIRETRNNLFRETAEEVKSWNPFTYYWRPSLTLQLKYLADLLHNLENSIPEQRTER